MNIMVQFDILFFLLTLALYLDDFSFKIKSHLIDNILNCKSYS